MSRLSEHISVTITNRRMPKPSSFISLEYTPSAVPEITNLYKIDFKASFGTSYYIDENLAVKGSPVIEETLRNVKKAVIEEIFGEFRQPINELRHAIYEMDNDRAIELLKNIEKQMYE